MSGFPEKIDALKPREIFDEILVLADDLLEDECPISQVGEWLFGIDDTLLQLKMWGETVGVEQGLLEDVVLDKDLRLIIGKMLRNTIIPLNKIGLWCKGSEAVESPQQHFRISAAVEKFQASASSLTDTIGLFQKYKARSNNGSFLQDFKPTGSITEYLYGEDIYHKQDLNQKAKEQQRISRLPPQLVEDSSYVVFLHELRKMSDQEKQAVRFGELAILSEQILRKIQRSKKLPLFDTIFYTEEEVLEVAATMSQFYQAWLTVTSTLDFAGSDAMSRAHRLPLVAKIWLIVHDMSSDHLLDSFCAKRMTDESLPLDILTLESILPSDEELSLDFYERQFVLVPSTQDIAPRLDSRHQGSVPIGEPDLELSEASSGDLSRMTLSGISFSDTTTSTGDPPVEETALNQPIPTKKAFARTSSHTGDSSVDETPNLRQKR